MSLSACTRWTVGKAVALVNLLVEEGEALARERLYETLEGYGLDETQLDREGFVALAGRLRDVFAAEDRGSRVEHLNVLLEHFQPSPRVVEHGGEDPHFHYVTGDGPAVDRVGASLAMALASAIVAQGAERFGWCAAPSCDRLFFDRSRNRSQRFCSRSCATRVHVADHRART